MSTEKTPARSDIACGARLSLILPGEDEECEVVICTKQRGHDSHHGDLSGYAWREYVEEESPYLTVVDPETFARMMED